MTAAPDLPLRPFATLIAEWFEARYGEPTDVQALAWKEIAAGRHALLTAPTGSGKTLAAFLWALDRLLTGEWETGSPRVLYVSPLKALGNDIRRNLTEPLGELDRAFADAGETVPRIRVESRTGDTPQSARRRMLRSPPEILITTPETLNILLTSKSGRRLLTGLRCVILDEIHAVAAGKRGIHLITAVERLVRLSGEFQRIALSATVRPLDRIAAWVGGSIAEGDPADPSYRPRSVAVVESSTPKKIHIEVALPSVETESDNREPDAFWASFGRQLRSLIARHRSTLIFGNARRSVEKIARFINEGAREHIAYSHHGALSREIRTVVEERLKAGELEAIVATSSLELGIDIGAIDEVVMVQTPPSVASTMQRLGRSGHGVGETSRGKLMPLLGRDLLEAAVVARAVVEGEIEELRPTAGALDVLAQVLLSMAVAEEWRIGELFASVRACDPYHHLPRRHFDLVVDMLAGRYATTRLRNLRPLVSIDRVDGTIRARPGADRLLFLSGGTIPDRGYYSLRVEGSGALLGELDEEFVWERSVGDTFTLGVQTWRVERITHNDVLVSPSGSRAAMAPFWRAEERDRSSFVSIKIAELLEDIEERLDDDALVGFLEEHHRFQRPAAKALLHHLKEQRFATGCLPHRHRLVVEHTAPPAGRGSHRQMILHTLWGGRVNRPFATALRVAWEDRFGMRPEVVHGADCVVVVYPASLECEDPLSLVPVAEIERLLHHGVERTGFFGARFREAASCALLLPRGFPGKRVPLWVNRQRAKELLEAVQDHDDFPLVLEAWRSCLQDDYELDELKKRLDEVADGRVAVRHVSTETPSPFTAQVAWKQTNDLMYEDDVPTVRAKARTDLVREMALSSHLRPRIDPALAGDLGTRLHRLAMGWAPRDAQDLLEWVKERLFIPESEWRDLLTAMSRDHGAEPAEVAPEIAHRAVRLRLTPETTVVCAVETLTRLADAVGRGIADDEIESLVEGGDVREALSARTRLGSGGTETLDENHLADLLGEWLRFYPPVTRDFITATFGLDRAVIDPVLSELADASILVIDELTLGADSPEVCDRVNLERLLRMARADARPSLEPLPLKALPGVLAHHQQLGSRNTVPEDLQAVFERLFGLPLPVERWETEILPARLEPYIPAWLDALLGESDLRWLGCGPKRVLFALDDERSLFPVGDDDEDRIDTAEVFPHTGGRYPFDELIRFSGLDSAGLTNRLWSMAWRGLASADTFATLRQGLAGGFSADLGATTTDANRRSRRGGFDRWRRQRPFTGAWFAVADQLRADDALSIDEDSRERARIVLDRYGIVFRSLLQRELPELKWSSIFRALRLLELGGEVVAGHFIQDVPGLQFASHDAVSHLREGPDGDRIWWLNATDPASPCGLGLPFDEWPLPRRVSSNHLVFHGRELVVVSQRHGADLDIRVAADHPNLPDYFEFLRVQLTRTVQPRPRVDLEVINGQPATASPFRSGFEDLFQVVRQPTCLRLMRMY